MDSSRPSSASSSSLSSSAAAIQALPQRKRGGLSDWVKIPERLTNSTDFEEFGYAPVDRIDYLCGVESPSIIVGHHKDENDQQQQFHRNLQHHSNNNHNNIGLFSKSEAELTRSGNYRISSQLAKPYSGPLNTIIRENYVSSSTPSSQETTPYCTPQSSPLIPRKKLLTADCNQPEVDGLKRSASGTAMAPPKKWFYNGVFTQPRAEGCMMETNKQTGGVRKFHVTNFDINAVGPTSW